MHPELRAKAEKEGKNIEGLAIVELAKHRNGPTGIIDLHFRKNFTRFVDLSDREPPPEAVHDDDDA